MSERKRDAATATLGYSGLVGAGALRHTGLERAYGAGGKRPKLAQELKLVRRGTKGKIPYVLGAALAVPSSTAAAYGTTGLLGGHPDRKVRKLDDGKKRRTFLQEGIAGARDSISNRVGTAAERPPAKLVAGNYALGAAIGSGAGGLAHLGLGRTKLPGSLRAGLATAAAVGAGSASIPAQSKLIERASRGKYIATAGGVKRKKTAPVRPSRMAEVQRPGSPVTKMSPRTAANNAGAFVGAHWTTNLSRVADRIEPYEARRARPVPRPVIDRHLPNAKRISTKLVRTGRQKAAETTRAVSYDVSSLNDKDKLVREVATGQGKIRKSDDPGAKMSRAERRARVTAAGGLPVVGDFAQAAAAARLSPQKYRTRTAAQSYAGGVGAGLAGNAAGAAGALALANRHQGFKRKAEAASDVIDSGKAKARSAVGLKPSGSSMTSRVLASDKTPAGVKRVASHVAASPAGRAIAKNPKVAAVGALVGGAVAGQVGQQLTYSRIMTRDDKYRRAQNTAGRHGTRVAKADAKQLTQREKKQLSRRKERSAAMSLIGGGTGLGALGATLASHHASPLKPAMRARLGRLPVPLLTTGAGVGGINAFTNAAIQHKEAKASLAKSAKPHLLEISGPHHLVQTNGPRARSELKRVLERDKAHRGMYVAGGRQLRVDRQRGVVVAKALRPTGLRRAPAMRKATIRQTRYPSGLLRVSTVRGGLG